MAKNLLNLKTLIAGMDPRVEGYSARLAHLALAQELLQQAADRYREKYELSTLRIDDIKAGINFLAALRRLHVVLGEVEQAEVVKKKAEIWQAKMENDLKKADQARKAWSTMERGRRHAGTHGAPIRVPQQPCTSARRRRPAPVGASACARSCRESAGRSAPSVVTTARERSRPA